MARTYALYLPKPLPPGAPLLVVLHASGETGDQVRADAGFEFDLLADQHGFVVVYPDGFEKHWDDCRKAATYSARTRKIDDVGFVQALIAQLHRDHAIDERRVFAVGYSNGGQMAYRLAFELPGGITAAAAIAASLPAEDNCDCRPPQGPVSVLIMNGTRDPINPYQGGMVSILGFGNRGAVLSARASAEYFARLDGAPGSPVTQILPGQSERDRTWAERALWSSPGGAAVELITIHGGGHVIPQSRHRFPRLVGPVDRKLDGPAEIWGFFARFSGQ